VFVLNILFLNNALLLMSGSGLRETTVCGWDCKYVRSQVKIAKPTVRSGAGRFGVVATETDDDSEFNLSPF
jgi:hypothetical protein